MSPRPASDAVIAGIAAISVGDPKTPVPEGWTRVLLSEVARLKTGHTPSRKHPEYWNGDVPWVSLPDARRCHGRLIYDTTQKTNAIGLANSAARLLPAGTVCLSRTASVGYVFQLAKPMATSQDFVNWVCSDALDPRFLMYALMAEGDHILEFGKGSTHTTIYFPEVQAFQIALAPIAEQRRIVEKIEALLARRGAAERYVAAARERLRALRAAVLTSAFRGSLIGLECVDYERLENLAIRFDYGTSSKSAPSGDVPVLRMSNIAEGEIDWNDLVFTSNTNEIQKFALQAGDVLFNRTNSPELVGKTAIYRGDRTAIHAGYLIRIRCGKQLDPEFLNICLNSPAGRAWCAATRTDGVSQSNISATKLKEFSVPSFTIDQQQKIVASVRAALRLLTAIELRRRSVARRTELLAQSILEKAFTGLLVTTEAELAEREGRKYEPASKLVERIRKHPYEEMVTSS